MNKAEQELHKKLTLKIMQLLLININDVRMTSFKDFFVAQIFGSACYYYGRKAQYYDTLLKDCLQKATSLGYVYYKDDHMYGLTTEGKRARALIADGKIKEFKLDYKRLVNLNPIIILEKVIKAISPGEGSTLADLPVFSYMPAGDYQLEQETKNYIRSSIFKYGVDYDLIKVSQTKETETFYLSIKGMVAHRLLMYGAYTKFRLIYLGMFGWWDSFRRTILKEGT